MHEAGHGLYAHGNDTALMRTPLAGAPSLGLNESQSRTWENLVGRQRPFWTHWYGRLQERFPSQLGSVDLERFLQAINRAEPGLIRVDADETTYSLHIILRFELEQEIINGTVALEDLPEIWNARMKEFLGVDVPDDAHGVLQDVHWSGGGMGYFPTYALGNVISLQIWQKVREELPDLDDAIAAGDVSRSATGSATGSTGTGASTRRRRCSNAWPAPRASTRSRISPTCATRSRACARSRPPEQASGAAASVDSEPWTTSSRALRRSSTRTRSTCAPSCPPAPRSSTSTPISVTTSTG